MSNTRKPTTDDLIDFLYDPSDESFSSSKESVARFDEGLKRILERGQRNAKQGWKERGRKQIDEFRASTQNTIKEFIDQFGSREALVSHILSGGLGTQAQRHLQVQFRNRSVDELSEQDLKSVLADVKLLELLSEAKKSK